MTDIAGLALGVVGVLKPLSEASLLICDLCLGQFSDQFGSDANALRVRISVSRRQIETFEKILLTDRRFNWLAGSLFQELEPALQQDVYDVLQELKRRLFLFVEIGKSYGVASPSTSQAETSTAAHPRIVESNDKILALQRDVGWARKTLWSAKDKKSLQRLADEIEHWTGLLRLTVQDALSLSPEFQTSDRLDTLGRPEEQAEELRAALSIRRILISKPFNISHPAPELSLRAIQIFPVLGSVTVGVLKISTRDANVLIESKLFGSKSPAEDEKRRDKAKQLATLLREAGDSGLRALGALGYIYDPLESRAMVVYGIPGHLVPQPLTLREFLSLKLLEPRPALEHRFQLASAVTESIFYFHSLGWVHKSFTSTNILFFPIRSLCSKPWQEAGTCSVERILGDSEIRLVGFDLARPEADVSSLSILSDSTANLYRPPTRWGVPTESWTATHDLYSLGAVLLEIGLWQSLDTLDRRLNLKGPWATQKLLLTHATQRLPYTMGSKYATIVVGLLKEEFDETARTSYPSLHPTGSPNHASNRLWILRQLNKLSTWV